MKHHLTLARAHACAHIRQRRLCWRTAPPRAILRGHRFPLTTSTPRLLRHQPRSPSEEEPTLPRTLKGKGCERPSPAARPGRGAVDVETEVQTWRPRCRKSVTRVSVVVRRTLLAERSSQNNYTQTGETETLLVQGRGRARDALEATRD